MSMDGETKSNNNKMEVVFKKVGKKLLLQKVTKSKKVIKKEM